MHGLCKPIFGEHGHVIKMLQAENEHKVDESEPISIGEYRFYWTLICGF